MTREVLRIDCECRQEGCNAQLLVSATEYESLRAGPRRFLVQPGHELAGAEHVVRASDGFFVIERPGAAPVGQGQPSA